MRLRLEPGSWTERIAFHLGFAPIPLVEAMGGMLYSRTLIAGVRLGVFDALENGPASAEELASRLRCSPDGMRVLLSALHGCAYLTLDGDRYANAPLARRWLVRNAPRSVADYLDFMVDQWSWVGATEEAIRTGVPVDTHREGQDPAYWERYMRGLAALARTEAEDAAAAIPLTRPPRRMLDVGGGHGVFSEALCRRYPGLEAEILDLPEVVRTQTAGETVDGARARDGDRDPVRSRAHDRIRSRAEDRIRYRAGDLRTADWGAGFDLVLLFNLLHHFSEEESRAALAKARAALTPGGTVAVWEFRDRQKNARRPSQVGGLLGLFFYTTSGRRVWPRERIEEWLRAAQFAEIRAKVLRASPFGVLITGTVPGKEGRP